MGRNVIASSFRAPNGFVFFQDGVIYRQINIRYKENYDYLINSGFYETLVGSGLLISHNEVDIDIGYARDEQIYKIVE